MDSCAPDFYVHESCQRRGLGLQLFRAMLASEGVEASALAYDQPSAKMLPFLARHFDLRAFVQQPNNYVLFENGLAALSPAVKKSDWDSVGSRPLTHRAGPGGRRR